MRLVKVKVPEGVGAEVAKIALRAGISHVGVYPQEVHSDDKVERKEVVDVETSTPLAKRFLDELTTAEVYDPQTMSYSVRDARAVVSSGDDMSLLTMPVTEPAVDVFANLWQFVHITPSFLLRVAVAALLLSYGMVHNRMLLMAGGLLFMPVTPLMLGVAFGGVTGCWRLVGRAFLSMAAAVAITVAMGYLVGSATDTPEVKFKDFTPLLPSLWLSIGIGVAAGIGTTDDVGWKELVGLAAASQFSLIPAWLGSALVKGFGEGGTATLVQRLESFGMNLVAIIGMAALAYLMEGMRKQGLRHTQPQGGRELTVVDELQQHVRSAA